MVRFIALAVAACGAQHAAFAATLVLSPSKDNTLFEDSTGSLSDGQGPYLYAGRTGEGNLRRGLIAFDLSSIPAGAVITDVTLSMFMSKSGPSSAAVDISLYAATRNWGEGASNSGSPGGGGALAQAGDATWLYNFYQSSSWTKAGGDFASTPSATTSVNNANLTYTWSGAGLKSDVQAWVSNPGANFGWAILGDELNLGSAERFNSGESSSNLPKLTVTYSVPEPAAGLLCAAGALALSRRRRSAQ